MIVYDKTLLGRSPHKIRLTSNKGGINEFYSRTRIVCMTKLFIAMKARDSHENTRVSAGA